MSKAKYSKRTIKAGSHHYYPKYGYWPRFGIKEFEIELEFDDVGWYDPSEDGPLGKDGADINKLGGVTSFDFADPIRTLPQNSCAALVGGNPSNREGRWDVYAYTNSPDKRWQEERLLTVASLQRTIVNVRLDEIDDAAVYRAVDRILGPRRIILPLDLRWLRWFCGPYHGGNRPSPVAGILYSGIKRIR